MKLLATLAALAALAPLAAIAQPLADMAYADDRNRDQGYSPAVRSRRGAGDPLLAPFFGRNKMLQQLMRLMDDTDDGGDIFSKMGALGKVHSRETDNELIYFVDVPGFHKDDVHVTLHGGRAIKVRARHVCGPLGGRAAPRSAPMDPNCIDREVRHDFTLPSDVDAKSITVNYEHGVIRIHMPKKEAMRMRIPVVDALFGLNNPSTDKAARIKVARASGGTDEQQQDDDSGSESWFSGRSAGEAAGDAKGYIQDKAADAREYISQQQGQRRAGSPFGVLDMLGSDDGVGYDYDYDMLDSGSHRLRARDVAAQAADAAKHAASKVASAAGAATDTAANAAAQAGDVAGDAAARAQDVAGSMSNEARRKAEDAAHAVGGKLASAAQRAREAMYRAGERAGDAAAGATDAAGSAAARATDTVASLASSATSVAGSAAEQATDAAGRSMRIAAGRAREAADEAAEKAEDVAGGVLGWLKQRAHGVKVGGEEGAAAAKEGYEKGKAEAA